MAQDFSTYVVKAGDSLSAIALKVYGNASRWTEIWEANKDKVKDPNLIHVGQQLRIPGQVSAAPAEEKSFSPSAGQVLPPLVESSTPSSTESSPAPSEEKANRGRRGLQEE